MQLKTFVFSAMAETESNLSKPDVEAKTHEDDVIVSTEPPSTGSVAYFSTLSNYYCFILTVVIVLSWGDGCVC